MVQRSALQSIKMRCHAIGTRKLKCSRPTRFLQGEVSVFYGAGRDSTDMGKALSRHCFSGRRDRPSSVESADGELVGPCTGTEPDCPCAIFKKLDALNDRLRSVGLELVEILPGQLSLSWYESPWDSSKLEPATTSQYDARKMAADIQYPSAGGDAQVTAKTEDRMRVLTIVQDVLATHRCVIAVDVAGRMFGAHEDLIRDAITRAGSSLRALRVRSVYHVNQPLVDSLCDAVGSLSRLRELAWTHDKLQRPPCGRLLAFLRTTSTLTSLDLTEVHMPFPHADAFFGALKKNVSLRRLTLSACLVIHDPNETSALLRDYLTSGRCDQLLSLTVRRSCTSHPPSLSAIVDGVCENRSLQDLSVAGFFLGRWNFSVVAKLLNENRTLRRLTLIGTSWFEVFQGSFTSREHWKKRESEAPNGFPRCLRALAVHRSLEQLTVDISTFTINECFSFCEAVRANKTLSAVTLARIRNEDVGAICNVIRKTGTEDRIRLDHAYVLRDGCCENVVEYPALIKNVVLDSENFRDPQMVGEALRLLPQFVQVSSLSLTVVYGQLFSDDDAVRSVVAKFLETSMTLRRLDLRLHMSGPLYGSHEVLLRALARNTSLRTLRIRKTRFTDPEIQLMASAIADSTTLCEFGFFVEDNNRAALEAFLRALEPHFSSNYSMLELNHSAIDECPQYLAVQRVLRRNRALAMRASHYVMGVNRSKRCARALEKVSCGQGVVRTVAEFASIDEYTAAGVVQQALEGLVDMTTFMKAAGVVQENVVCHPLYGEKQGGLRLQLDRLDADSWRHVRRYIRLADIVDTDCYPPL
ncbi:uncharacterized protein LOC119443198 isoform X2 [Dermacentor silvarum]|uniref:uncharacterized protein LOC119443198 isoform X2 n=1 Tax=Dermacentor silvarum TaxID=543639 RepID=UPI002101BB11|nr:uncharacterized protein LOC119443198 isoform X2 [Dermacentor silvarum]